MSAERQDDKQAEAFRAFARHISDADSDVKFKEALRRLMAPMPEPELASPSTGNPGTQFS
jgi:hypothetical protein